jgi:hypothetical protein
MVVIVLHGGKINQFGRKMNQYQFATGDSVVVPGARSGTDTSSEPHTQDKSMGTNVKDPNEPLSWQLTRCAATEGSSHGYGHECYQLLHLLGQNRWINGPSQQWC